MMRMATISESLAAVKAINGVNNIFLFVGSELFYSSTNPPPKKLLSLFQEVLPALHERYFQENERLEAIEMHLASYLVMLYCKEGLSLILLCEAQVDSALLSATISTFLSALLQNQELQRRVKNSAGM
jgi:hypothetical protein